MTHVALEQEHVHESRDPQRLLPVRQATSSDQDPSDASAVHRIFITAFTCCSIPVCTRQ